jgi:hypothetical protein
MEARIHWSKREDEMTHASNRRTIFSHLDRVLVARAGLLAFAVLLFALPAAAQGDEDEGYRDSLYTNADGDALVIWSPEGSDDVSLELRLRMPNGSETTLASDGQSVTTSAGSETLVGFGSNPTWNNSGVGVFKGGLEYNGDMDEDDDACGIFRVTDTTLTLIAEGRGDDPQGTGNGSPDGQPFNGDTMCDFGPMPRIGDGGHILFEVQLDRGDEAANGATVTHLDFYDCGRESTQSFYDDANDYPHERRAIVRRNTGGSLSMLMRSYDDDITILNSGNTADYVSTDTTFDITNVHFNFPGFRLVNDSGFAVTRALLDDDITDDSTSALTGCGGNCSQRLAWYDDRDALFYLRDSDYRLIAAAGPPGESIFQELDTGVINDSGQVLFKGLEGTGGTHCGYWRRDGSNCSDQTWASLNRWTLVGGRQEIVSTDDQAPSSDYYYQGFSPHYTMNNSGDVAFVAGLGDDSDPVTTDECGQGVYYWNGSSVTEIARAMDDWDDFDVACTADTGGPFTTSFDGFVFHEIGSMASVTDDDWVFFVVENYDAISGGDCDGVVPDDDEVTALLGWHPVLGMREIMREGSDFDGELVNRIYAPMPELRAQTYGDQFAVTVVFDTDRDCVYEDADDVTEVVVPEVGTQGAGHSIPTLGRSSILLLVILIAGIGVALSRRYA